MNAMEERGWPGLAEAVTGRRLALGLSVNAAAERAGVNRATWASIEAGTARLRRQRWAAFERVLGWAPGSIAAIIQGDQPAITAGEPAPITRQPPERGVDETIELVRSDDRLSNEMKVRIIGLIHERRERQREAEIAETRRLIEVMRETG